MCVIYSYVMVNPFGETSGSKYEWMSKYESEKSRADVYQARVTELQGVIKEYEEALNKVIKTKEEIETDSSYLRQMIAERDETIENLKKQGTTKSSGVKSSEGYISELEGEIKSLKNELDKVKSQSMSGSKKSSPFESESLPSKMQRVLIPTMMNLFNSEDNRFEDAFQNFVESVIEFGETSDSIIANLIKYGGSGPKDKLQKVINQSDYDFAIDQLSKQNLIKISGEIISITGDSGMESMDQMNWKKMSFDEMFETLDNLVESAGDADLIKGFENFRDAIQERDIPATTIFFSIRKAIEGVQKHSLKRDEIKKMVNEWKNKFL
jgi:uncharacterized coiled-coil DUF342 family protein